MQEVQFDYKMPSNGIFFHSPITKAVHYMYHGLLHNSMEAIQEFLSEFGIFFIDMSDTRFRSPKKLRLTYVIREQKNIVHVDLYKNADSISTSPQLLIDSIITIEALKGSMDNILKVNNEPIANIIIENGRVTGPLVDVMRHLKGLSGVQEGPYYFLRLPMVTGNGYVAKTIHRASSNVRDDWKMNSYRYPSLESISAVLGPDMEFDYEDVMGHPMLERPQQGYSHLPIQVVLREMMK